MSRLTLSGCLLMCVGCSRPAVPPESTPKPELGKVDVKPDNTVPPPETSTPESRKLVGFALWWYIAAERRDAISKQWLEFDEAYSFTRLQELERTYAKEPVGRVAGIAVARSLLGPMGLDRIDSLTIEGHQKAVENIEKARDAFGKLLPQFENDAVFKAECLLGLAKAEAALVGVPVKFNELTEFRGKVSKVVEYLDQLSATAAPNTTWSIDSKKLADALRNEKARTAIDFVRIQRALTMQSPLLPELDLPGPGRLPGIGLPGKGNFPK